MSYDPWDGAGDTAPSRREPYRPAFDPHWDDREAQEATPAPTEPFQEVTAPPVPSLPDLSDQDPWDRTVEPESATEPRYSETPVPHDWHDEQWGVPEDPAETVTPVAVKPARPPKEPRVRRAPISVPRWVYGAAVVAALAIAGIIFVPQMLPTQTEATQRPTSQPTEPTEPTPPESTLSQDPKQSLPFDAKITSGMALSFVSSGFVEPEWVEVFSYEKDGYSGFTQKSSGCTVRWMMGTADFDAKSNDYSASLEALHMTAKTADGETGEYGYWTKTDTPKPQSKAEVVETRVGAGDGDTIVSVRAVVETGQVGVIWATCADPQADVSDFTDTIRSMIGFAMVKQ